MKVRNAFSFSDCLSFFSCDPNLVVSPTSKPAAAVPKTRRVSSVCLCVFVLVVKREREKVQQNKQLDDDDDIISNFDL